MDHNMFIQVWRDDCSKAGILHTKLERREKGPSQKTLSPKKMGWGGVKEVSELVVK